MKILKYLLIVNALVIFGGLSDFAQTTEKPANPGYDAELATKLGADQYGMRNYVLAILKTGPKDALIKGLERDEAFKGHMANIGRMAAAGQLAVAGPFGENDKGFRGIFIFNVKTIEEAGKLTETDLAVKAGIFVVDIIPWYGTAALMQVNGLHKKLASTSF